jgi:hypothetical protein
MSIANDKRKTFYLNKDKEKPITAGGVILYRFVKNNMELLLADSRGAYEDLGGCVDDNDKNIYETVSREAYEESNKLLSKTKIKNRLKDAPSMYAPRSKYVVYIIEANGDEAMLKCADFGEKELHDDIFRKIRWIPLDTFLLPETIKHKLNWRLKNTILFSKLKEIKNNKNLDINLFSASKSDSDTDSEEEVPKKGNKK